jgi:hypothetical protein
MKPPQRVSNATEDLALFGPPPLLPGEDGNQYDRLLRDVSDIVTPTDIFEQIWVRDFANRAWETFRCRRLFSELCIVTKQQALVRVLGQLLPDGACIGQLGNGTDSPRLTKAEDLAWRYSQKEQNAVNEISRLLKLAGLTLEILNAEALSVRSDDFERLNRMITTAEARRNATLREIDRHRKGLGAELRRVIEQTEYAKHSVTEKTPADEMRAA